MIEERPSIIHTISEKKHKMLSGKHEGKRLLVKQRLITENNIKMDFC
jgi:hypothetical protein